MGTGKCMDRHKEFRDDISQLKVDVKCFGDVPKSTQSLN